MALGGYEIKVATGSMPQNVASGWDKVFENMVGAKYEPIAYLGSQVVNGKNHAILAVQKLIYKEDITNIVLVVLNEKPGDIGGDTLSIVEIQSLLSNGGKMGGLVIDPKTNIPADAKAVFDKHFAGFLGAANKPFALLATQMVRGGAYVFAVESTMVVGPKASEGGTPTAIDLVKVFGDFDELDSVEVLSGVAAEDGSALKSSADGAKKLGYSFTWLRNTNAAGNLGSPLGEWP